MSIKILAFIFAFTLKHLAAGQVDTVSCQIIFVQNNTKLSDSIGLSNQVLAFEKELMDSKVLSNVIIESGIKQTEKDLRSKMRIKNIPFTHIYQIKYPCSTKEQGKKLLDVYLEELQKSDLTRQMNQYRNQLSFIDNQLEHVALQINETENSLAQTKDEKGIMNLQEEDKLSFEKLVKVEKEIEDNYKKILEIDELEMIIQSDKLNAGIAKVHPIKEIRQSLLDLIELQTDAEKNKVLISTKKTEILDALAFLKKTKKGEIAHNKQVIRELQIFIKSMDHHSIEFNRIKRSLEVSEKIYTLLLEKRAMIQIQQAAVFPSFKIIESPR